MVNQIPEEDDCVSIEDELNIEEEKGEKEQIQYQFEDPACFFASKLFDFWNFQSHLFILISQVSFNKSKLIYL